MTLIRTGGLAAWACAATYGIGFALLVTVLAPLGYGTKEIDIAAVVAFINASPGLLIFWNTTIYIVNALALACLVVALASLVQRGSSAWAELSRALGLIWATLVLGAGMIANVAIERVLTVFPSDPEGAVEIWTVLHAVELGLGGGNEIAGGAWCLCVSLAGQTTRTIPVATNAVGICTGLAGLATLAPPMGDTAGAIFGLGALVWFLLIGLHLVRAPGRS